MGFVIRSPFVGFSTDYEVSHEVRVVRYCWLMNFRIERPPLSAMRVAHLDRGVAMLVPFDITFEIEDLEVVVSGFDVADGRPTCASYMVRRSDGRLGVEEHATTIARGIQLRSLLADAAALAADDRQLAAIASANVDGSMPQRGAQESEEAKAAARTAAHRRRKPITDEWLRGFVARHSSRPGSVADFAKAEGYTERHTYDLLKLAKSRGIDGED
jgi:hypothetical protein